MTDLIRVKAQSASELLQHFSLSEEGEGIVDDKAPPKQVIEALLASDCFHDAVTLLAHALPKREAVWWACLANKTTMDQSDAQSVGAVAAAEQWVREPTESNRQKVKTLSDKIDNKTAAGWLATAATWSTGNMADTGDEVIHPPTYLYAQAVATSITLAAVDTGADEMTPSYQRFIRQGFDLAGGGSGQIEV